MAALTSIFHFPSIDYPFGIELWPIFEQGWLLIRGFKPQDFRVTPGSTPLSTLRETIFTLISYYIVIFGGRELMRKREAFSFPTIFKIHNFMLTLISGGLLVLFIEQMVPTLTRDGVFSAICDGKSGWTDKLVVLYYLNYFTKYIELMDTVFLVLKKKPLTFLHTYHHGATALLCYIQLVGHTPISWVPISLNLLVHVFMYWYYFQSARGIKIWWKQYITVLQILQFIIDLGFVYFASYNYFSSTYFPWMPYYGKCAGEEFAAVAGCVILSSYLVLFILFYIATYKKTGKGGRPRRNTATKATIDMARAEIPSIGHSEDASGHENGHAKSNGDAVTTARSSTTTRSRKA